MSTNFPSSIDADLNPVNGDVIQPAHVGNLYDAMIAVQTALLDVRISNYLQTSNQSTSSHATKGCLFTPSRNLKLYALYMCGDFAGTSTYRAYVATLSGGAIATLTNGSDTVPPFSLTDSALLLPFATPVTLSSGVTYALLVGRRDSTDNFALPVTLAATVTSDQVIPGTWGDNVTVTEATPIVTTSASTASATSQFRPGYVFGF